MQRIAQILKSNGRDGELLMSFVGIAPEDIDTREPVFIEFDGLPVPFYFESFTPRGTSRALVRLTGVQDEEEDLTGWTVLNADGTVVGTVSAHEDIPGNPCIWVETGHGEALIPLREELVLEVDEEKETLRMEIPEGLLDL